MPWRSPRKLLFACFALDLFGVVLGASLANLHREPDLLHPPEVLLAVALLYGVFSWLLGGYTLLRWPWLRLRLVCQRLGLIALATISALILISWAGNITSQNVALLNRGVLLELMLWQSMYSLGLRLLLRRLNSLGSSPAWQLFAAPQYHQSVMLEWQRNPFVRPPKLYSQANSFDGTPSANPDKYLAVSCGTRHETDFRQQLAQLKSQGITVTTFEELAQAQLERLPPSLLPQDWLNYDELCWGQELSLQRKIKRTADVFLSLLLLLLTAPIVIIFAGLIWLEDRGPIFYNQQRSGWLGKPFNLLKLRSMRPNRPGDPTPWTMVGGDSRITRVGTFLRRSRIDELPQLINVLRGEMSLIGPRPEQPNLDETLEVKIPHYRKRYWMLPGLSGWAQVCGPAYPASLEETELKLSYDLYYLRNWTIWLDLLIFAKTIKTVLKVRGV